jgi:hypothetical protein
MITRAAAPGQINAVKVRLHELLIGKRNAGGIEWLKEIGSPICMILE